MNRMYRNHLNGLSGNDDCGQMSAWYIFTSLGFYPVCPGSNQYVLGAPYLPARNYSFPTERRSGSKRRESATRNDMSRKFI